MNKSLVKMFEFVVLIALLACSGSGDPENKPPQITLIGDSTVEISVGGNYVDAGAVATDEEDGDISDKIVTVNPVDTNLPGTHMIRYNVTDTDGSSAPEVKRTVIVTNPNDWTNELTKQKYLEVALNICEQHQPEYLGLGVEVNTYYESYPEDFARYVEYYKVMYETIKDGGLCPDVKIFVTFQLEKMKGLGQNVGFSGISQWEIFDMFDGKLDLLVFTSYPEFEYVDANDIPNAYYDGIYDNLPASLLNIKIGFSEMGWNSEQNLYADADNSIGMQADFISWFAQITNNLNTGDKLEFATWIFMHDFQIGDFMVGRSMGLKNNDGTHKEILPGYTVMDHFLQLKSSQGIMVGAAPIPRNFPDASSDDWVDLYGIYNETIDILTAQAAWYDSEVELGEIPKTFQDFYDMREIFQLHDAVILYGVNFHNDGEPDIAVPIF
jgi:hypothetical protein